MKKVVIVQRIIPHYRVPFFKKLRERLKENGIELLLVYGQELPGTVPKSVDINEEWACKVNNHYIKALGVEIVWQPCLQHVSDADLVIIEHANRLILNYILFAIRFYSKRQLAFWGHGANLQSNKARFLEHWKRFFVNKVDWWFAYTTMSVTLVKQSGFHSSRITRVQNSIDSKDITDKKESITNQELKLLRDKFNLTSENVAIYCGGMYAEKRLNFLLEACFIIKDKVPDFNMIFIGSGPDHHLVKKAAENNKWIHDIGPITSANRVPYFMVSKYILMPGLVGLVILDSFILETPLITTKNPTHSPEIDYLNSFSNGIETNSDVNEYASVVVKALRDLSLLEKLKTGCRESSKKYTLENMVCNFSEGIMNCLNERL